MSQSQPITFQTTILHMGNNTGIPVPPEVVEALGAGKRPLVQVTVNDPAFEHSAPSQKEEYVRQVISAKQQATRERRIAKILDKLRAQ
ncbi:MAG: DUF1905 domain-containing protein [Chloroflexia bacterium]|nr:DUF1905 domain-containing protein [Chloroflexia bacterium]